MGLEKLEEIFKVYKDEWKGRLGREKFSEHVKKIRPKLIEVARSGELITYKELTNGFRMISRADVGGIVGGVSHMEHLQDAPLISAVVINKEAENPGGGFLGLPAVPPSVRRDRDYENSSYTRAEKKFWEKELERVQKHWQGKK